MRHNLMTPENEWLATHSLSGLYSEYRCTRNEPYDDPNCPGFRNPKARQGHYISATSKKEAIALMQLMFPNDKAGFTAHLW